MKKPAPSEHDPYFKQYIDLVEGEDLLGRLESVHEETRSLLSSLSEDRAGHRYAEGKWSIKEVIGHLIDCERILTMRSLVIARGDRTELPGFDQDLYVRTSGADRRRLVDLAEEHDAVRKATVTLFRSFDDAMLVKQGIANESIISVRALGFVVAGHEVHHTNVIRDRYLPT